MLLKLGVDISRLARPIRRKLGAIDLCCIKHDGNEAVVTSTYEGTHSLESLHYSNEAIDIRKPDRGIGALILSLKKYLGRHYDVIDSTNCIHIEYDPK